MSEIGSISVSINGDASGLLSAVSSAQTAITSLTSAANGLKNNNVSVKIDAVDNATAVISKATQSVNAFSGLNPKATISALDNTGSGVASAKAAINSIQDKVVTITVQVNQVGSIGKYAKGTRSALGGLSRINDEKGISDPRELVYHKGNYYLFEGQDVLVPLDKGDRVYTASQTKNIMRMNGIPSYARGMKNEMFEFDKRRFTNSTKTSNMAIPDQIEWWKNALNEYAYDSEVVMECEEEIYSLTKKLVKEINGVSEAYVTEHSQLNNWENYSDSALDAFARIRERNFEYLKDGVITWEDYCDTLTDIGTEMYNERIKHSENWLNQEYKYNEMSIEDYIAGLDRMAKYTQQYYDNGMIGSVDYFYGMQKISNKKSDMQSKQNSEDYRNWQKSASGYLKQRNTYGDWDAWGDNLVEYYKRCIERQQEFFDAGKIDWETYNDAIINYKMELYKAEKSEAESMYKSLLDYANNYVTQIKNNFKSEKNDLDYKLKITDIDSDMGKQEAIKEKYSHAVTQKGRDVFEKAEDKLNDLKRERQKVKLDYQQNTILSNIESQYKEIESVKNIAISKIMNGTIDVNNLLNNIQNEFNAGQSDVCSLLTQVINAIKNSSGSTVYGGTTYNIKGADSSFIGPLLKKTLTAVR